MIILTGKIVFVKTQEEYLSVLKMAKLQGFTWARENHLNPIVIPFPNILNFYDSKIVTYNYVEKTVYEASEIVEDEEKIKDAVKLVRTFAKYPDRTALTEPFIESLKLLADTVESQMEEVKQMERLTRRINNSKIAAIKGAGCNYSAQSFDCRIDEGKEKLKVALERLADYEDIGTPKELKELKENGAFTGMELAQIAGMQKEWKAYKDAEEQSLLMRLPVKIGTDVYKIPSKVNYDLNILNGRKEFNRIYHQKVYNIVFTVSNRWYVLCDKDSIDAPSDVCLDTDYGKIWFTSREEAERKLEEMGE